MASVRVHLQNELLSVSRPVVVQTQFGPVKGCRALNEVPYALPPGRFEDPKPLPADYRYEDKEFIYESKYCVQPSKSGGQVAGAPPDVILGLGKPSEDPLFVNIVSPPRFAPDSKVKYPVKVYIHGGFLQSGSPHELNSQAQYVAAECSAVWVNIGYRVSVFGFLTSDKPKVKGNFGFKDQWLALLWIQDNIDKFGGDSQNIQVTGFSTGAHSVHQLLHHASRLPEGSQAPFQSAMLQSNGILTTPATPIEHRPQFQALCNALCLDPSSPSVLSQLRDTSTLPWDKLTHVIETGELGAEFDTFRGTLEGSWLPTMSDTMSWQRTGDFARVLRAKGVRSIIVGDLAEEWFVYSLTQPVHTAVDVEKNLCRYYPAAVVRQRFGVALANGQAHLPVRLLARDLINAGFPVLRYEIRWTPEQVRPFGYVTHGTDRALWAFRLPTLEPSQIEVARAWLDAIDKETRSLEGGANVNARDMRRVFALKEDKTMGWKDDDRWDEVMRLRVVLPGED